MGLFSKLFGNPKPESEPLAIPEGATPQDVIGIAIRSVIQEAGGNCATLVSAAEPSKWVQIMDSTINCHYPHEESPEWLYPELTGHPIIAGLEGFEDGCYVTVSLNNMDEPGITEWIGLYFSQVLGIPADAELDLRMEEI